tara:strand:- start:1778 stop:3586 length:1809 start_codon:yes stop_codon:yes gene_type:complete
VFDHLLPWTVLVHASKIRRASKSVFVTSDNCHNGEIFYPFCRRLAYLLCRKSLTRRRLDLYDYMFDNPCTVPKVFGHKLNDQAPLVEAIAASSGVRQEDAGLFVKKCGLEKACIQSFIVRDMKNRRDKVCVITDSDPFGIYAGSDLAKFWRSRFGALIASPFLTALMTLVSVIKTATSFRWKTRCPQPRRRSLLVHNTGFGYAGELLKSFTVDDYFFDNETNAAFLTDQWDPGDKIAATYISDLDAAGIGCEDFRAFTMSPMLFIGMLLRALKIYIACASRLKTWLDISIYWRLITADCREFVYSENIDCDAFLSLDDYSERHFVRTWLLRARGRKSLIVHHSAGNGVYALPSLAFICADAVLVWSRFIHDLYRPYWGHLSVVPYGYNRIDSTLRARGLDKPSQKGRKTVIITLPGFTDLAGFDSVFTNGEMLFDFLNQVDTLKTRLAIRPKNYIDAAAFSARVPSRELDFLIDPNITTVEYLLSADLVITLDGSGIAADCAVIETPVVFMDLLGVDKNIYDKFGSEMRFDDGAKLADFTNRFVNGQPVDVDFKKVWAEMSYPYDANRNAIIKNIVNGERTGSKEKNSLAMNVSVAGAEKNR